MAQNFDSPASSPQGSPQNSRKVSFPEEKKAPPKNLYRDIHRAAQNTATLNWTRNQWGNIPPPVAGHSLTKFSISNEDNPNEVALVVLFGGNADLSQPRAPTSILKKAKSASSSLLGSHNTLMNSVFVLDSSNMEWKEVIPSGTHPSPRYAHAAVTWDNNNMVVFGGRQSQHDSHETFVLHTSSDYSKWKWQAVEFIDDVHPPASHGHTLTKLDETKAILWGGSHGKTDTWMLLYDPESMKGKWKKIDNISGTPPEPRAYHGAACVSSGNHHYLVIFGGKSPKGKHLNDLNVADFEIGPNNAMKANWVTPPPIQTGDRPAPRYSHTMTIVQKKIFIFGGVGTKSFLNDLHIFEIYGQKWTTAFTSVPPSIRSRCASTFIGNRILMFGGVTQTSDDNDQWLSDLIVLDTEAKAPSSIHNNPNNNNNNNNTNLEFKITFTSKVDEEGKLIEHSSPTEMASSKGTLNYFGSLSREGIGSMANLLQGHGVAAPVGLRILELLLKHFIPIQGFNYEAKKPSHQWNSKEARLEFIEKLPQLFSKVASIMDTEPTCLQIRSPAYVLGDIHGNYKDLIHFSNMFWKMGVKLCPAHLLFLGDYVDRGPHSVETVAYIFALKMTHPSKVTLLRGNHETANVNGDLELYGTGSFKAKCRELCTQAGSKEVTGDILWKKVNEAFEFLPLAAMIDGKVFCMHGGVPRYLQPDIIDKLSNYPRPITSPQLDEDSRSKNALPFDLLWSDPATGEEDDEMEKRKLDFAANDNRGGSTAIFGTRALNKFLDITGCTHIIRAHQPPDLGVEVEKAARVLTVFSSSHFCTVGEEKTPRYNLAAAVLVADQRLRIIVLKPKVSEEDEIDDNDNFQVELDENFNVK